MFAWRRHLPIFPANADSMYDLKNDMRGTGAWRIEEYSPSVRQVYVKNPDWYDADKMLIDKINYVVSSEYATNLAQFRAGGFAWMEVQAEDILQQKRDLPHLLIKPQEIVGDSDNFHRFSYLPNSPFLDVRVRRAVSMTWDRDLYIDTFGNTKQFEDAGIEVQKKWNTAIEGDRTWWLDPKSKEFGPESAVFFHNPGEAVKLMEAAGFSKAKPLEAPFNMRTENSESYYQRSEVLTEMMNQSGVFKITPVLIDYRTEWRPKYHYGYNKHEGLARIQGGGGPDVSTALRALWLSGPSKGGADADRRGHTTPDGGVDTYLNDLIFKQQSEPDINKRQEMLNEFQRYAAKTMYMLWGPGGSTGFDMANPWVGNWGAYYPAHSFAVAPVEVYPHYWIDESKRT
jgi:ABC-type transport system substrate-binding protein